MKTALDILASAIVGLTCAAAGAAVATATYHLLFDETLGPVRELAGILMGLVFIIGGIFAVSWAFERVGSKSRPEAASDDNATKS